MKTRIGLFLAAAVLGISALVAHNAKAANGRNGIYVGSITMWDAGANNEASVYNLLPNGTDGGFSLNANQNYCVQCAADSAPATPVPFCYETVNDGGFPAENCYGSVVVPSTYVGSNDCYLLWVPGGGYNHLGVQLTTAAKGRCDVYWFMQPKGTGQAQ